MACHRTSASKESVRNCRGKRRKCLRAALRAPHEERARGARATVTHSHVGHLGECREHDGGSDAMPPARALTRGHQAGP